MIYHIDWLKEKGIKGAVYDLDGTIADSMGVWQDIYRELFSYYRIPFDGDFLSKTNHIAMAERAELLAETYLPNQTKKEVLTIWREIVQRNYREKVRVKPHTFAAIEEQVSNGFRLSVATATDAVCCAYFLKEKGIAQYFRAITALNEVKRSKAFPDIYLLAAKKMNLGAEACVVFEDSLAGITGAKRGGFCTVGVEDLHATAEKQKILSVCDFYLE